MFFVTGAYHRYFSHRSYKTSRWFQFVLGVGATLTAQKGPLWWARASPHPPQAVRRARRSSLGQAVGVLVGSPWLAARRDLEDTDLSRIKDFARYPELVWLNRWWVIPPFALGTLTFVPAVPRVHVGVLRVPGAVLARHVHDQLAVASVGRRRYATATTRAITPCSR